MREYTVQFLIDYDWHRITAIYPESEGALNHAKDLLLCGTICRVLGRERNGAWHTINLDSDGRIKLVNPIYNCPK